ncbi:MAG: DNA repair protein RecN [Kiritimatiellae bacterium]|nr:DNA repair protein RecN [Kiritimatiellia bacterium]
MLQQLSVRNLAIVEEARVDFAPGLNVVTGETGAGKSVLIGALNLVLGERADRGLIRAGAAEASVEARFQLADSRAVDARLAEAGLPPCEDGQLIVRRTIAATGAGRCWINDAAATAQTLRQAGLLLVDMHGPYDHQSLLSTDFQLELLDAFGHCGPDTATYDAYRAAYDDWKKLERERASLAGSGDGVAAESDRLSFVASEIAAAQLSEADGDELIARHAEAANAEAILALGTAVSAALDEGEGSAFEGLAAAQQRLVELARLLPEAESWLQETRAAAVQVQELGRTIGDRLQRIETDPGLLAQLEERMALVQKLKRKYGPTVTDVLATLARAETRLAELRSRAERLAALDGEIARAADNVRDRAAALTRERQSAARKLAKAITRELRDLGFAKAAFDVALAPCEPGARGADTVEFRFAPNPGEPASALRAIASSGEISRVMLATKSVLAEHDRIPLLVFDEIDANIGGEIGRAVGRKLRAVAARHQIICITHLPQVAAYGHAHYAVSKSVQGARTCARIEPVADSARAAEMARMLGGADMTSVTLAHAREMLRTCQQEPIAK